MEENRLKPMGDYDPKVFKKIYDNTRALTAKLSRQIDHNRLGVDNSEIQSWFDVKFIHAFNTYHKKHDEDILLAFIIRSLQLFKYRIMRSAYTIKNTQRLIPVEDYTELEEYDTENPFDNKQDELLESVLDFLKTQVSENAYLVLDIQLNPPPYILKQLENQQRKTKKIPNSMIADYLGLGTSADALKLVDSYFKEIEKGIELARQFFKTNVVIPG